MLDKLNVANNIGINQLQKLSSITNQKAEASNSLGFGETLKQAINQVNQLENQASHMGKLLAAGKIDNLHDVVIAGQKASLAVELTVQVRNKAVEAYQEVMRMQV